MRKQTDYEQQNDKFEQRAKVASKTYRQAQRQMRDMEVEQMVDEDATVRDYYQGIRIR
jgi:hypothetical protein